MKLQACFYAAAALALAMSTPSHATTLTGALNFSGGSVNFYDPANGFVPAGFNNEAGQPVTVDAGTEFGFQDGSNLDAADFTANTLEITDFVFDGANPGAIAWTQTFTASTPGFFNNLSLVSSNFTGLTFAVANDTLTLNWTGTSAPDVYVADFAFGGAVPEPGTWALFIVGFGAVGAVLRRDRKRQVLQSSFSAAA